MAPEGIWFPESQRVTFEKHATAPSALKERNRSGKSHKTKPWAKRIDLQGLALNRVIVSEKTRHL